MFQSGTSLDIMKKSTSKTFAEKVLDTVPQIELLRLQRCPDMDQETFIRKCGFAKTTYWRWLSGESKPRLTIEQLKIMAQVLGIDKIEELPDDFAPICSKKQPEK